MSHLGKVAIIGMGPLGLMIAHFAKDFSDSISIFGLPTGVGEKMAGRAAGGMLATAYECFGEYNDDFIDFALRSRDLWNTISSEYDIKLDDNAIAVANTAEMENRLELMANIGRNFGFKMENANIPDGIVAKRAIRLDCDALIDPIEVLVKTHSVLNNHGVSFRYQNIESIGDKCIFADGVIYEFDTIIIAAGYNSSIYAEKFPILNNLVPIRGQTLLISYPPSFKGSLRNETTYLMARGNFTAVGATANQGDDWNIFESEIAQLSNMARNLMPDLSKGQIIASFAGIRPQTTDGLPILGALDSNIWFAGGAYRNGWLLAPIMAKILINHIAKDEEILPFLMPSRFGISAH